MTRIYDKKLETSKVLEKGRDLTAKKFCNKKGTSIQNLKNLKEKMANNYSNLLYFHCSLN